MKPKVNRTSSSRRWIPIEPFWGYCDEEHRIQVHAVVREAKKNPYLAKKLCRQHLRDELGER